MVGWSLLADGASQHHSSCLLRGPSPRKPHGAVVPWPVPGSHGATFGPIKLGFCRLTRWARGERQERRDRRQFPLGHDHETCRRRAPSTRWCWARSPEDKDAVAEALENGRTVIQGWCRASTFGHSVTNGGCVRMPAAMRRHVQICDRRVNESPDGRCESRLAMSYGTGPESRQRLGTAH